VSSRRSSSRASSIAGSFFFDPGLPSSGIANICSSLETIEFPSAPGDGVDAHTGNACQPPITAVAQLFGFETDIEPALSLIKRAEEKIHVGVELASEA
jgi:hypothetical protein